MEVREKIEKVKNNKALKLIGNILYTIVFILVLLVLIVAILLESSLLQQEVWFQNIM